MSSSNRAELVYQRQNLNSYRPCSYKFFMIFLWYHTWITGVNSHHASLKNRFHKRYVIGSDDADQNIGHIKLGHNIGHVYIRTLCSVAANPQDCLNKF